MTARMTPNPNPSPELRVAALNDIARVVVKAIEAGSCADIWSSEMLPALNRFAALSPQTLPAPGEVEQRARKVLADTRIAAGSLFGGCPDDVAVSAMLAFAIATQPAMSQGGEVTQKDRDAAGLCDPANRVDYKEGKRDDSIIVQTLVRHRLAALATVAAANDEGVALRAAEALLPYTSHAIGCAIYQQTWANGAPKCNCGIEEARAAIRHLSQGGIS